MSCLRRAGCQPQPPAEQSLPSAPSGPPPLDRVHAGSLTLELEPIDTSLLGTVVAPPLARRGRALVTALAIVCGLWLALAPRPATQPVAIELEGGTAKVVHPPRKQNMPRRKPNAPPRNRTPADGC